MDKKSRFKTSQEFYKELTAEGLAKRKLLIHTKQELAYLKNILFKDQHILDLACGYGRFTIPLFKQGYNIQGLDISANLINKAKHTAKKKKLKIKFKLGDMRSLPYKTNQFDAIICMWSAFTELHKEKDQLKALKEIKRVLKKSGFAIFEMFDSNVREKVQTHTFDGVTSPLMYNHNRSTMKKLFKKIKARKSKTILDNFGGRERLIAMFWK